jgi:hypothetical protein
LTEKPNIAERIGRLFETWANALQGIRDDRGGIEYFGRELPLLMEDSAYFRGVLERIASGGPYPDIQRSGLFENEIVLHTNPSNLFSLRIAMYEPGEYTVVHDHSSWGVFGTLNGRLETVEYERIDDGSMEGAAKLAEKRRSILNPFETASTLPLNDGIHSIGNPGNELVVTATVYGKPLRRLFVNRFDTVNHRVERAYPPKIRKKLQARRALEQFA